MSDSGVYGELSGVEMPLDAIEYDVSHSNYDGYVLVEVTFNLGFAEFTVQFDLESAEGFIVEVRDEVVKAKQAELDWETDTDPETGVVAEGE